jgi:hypothetical protein
MISFLPNVVYSTAIQSLGPVYAITIPSGFGTATRHVTQCIRICFERSSRYCMGIQATTLLVLCDFSL